MSKGLALTLVLVFLTASYVMVAKPISAKTSSDFWVEKAPMPNPECFFGAASVNGEIYAIGSSFTYVFNPDSDSWVSKMSMPSHRQGFAIAAYQGKIYVIGGWNSSDPTGLHVPLGTNEMYNPTTDSWTTKASMPIPTMNLQANVVNGKIFLISGLLGTNALKEYLSNATWIYDPSKNSWSQAAPIPTPVFVYASAAVDNKIFIEGGEEGSSSYLSDLNQIYNTETNTWSLGEPLPVTIKNGAASATSGVWAPVRLYVIGGTSDGSDSVGTTQLYDPQMGNWTLVESMPTFREGLAVAVVNDTLYAMGGVSEALEGYVGTIYNVTEQYIPIGFGTTPPKISASQPFPTLPVVAVSGVIAVVVVAGLLVYFKKHKDRVHFINGGQET